MKYILFTFLCILVGAIQAENVPWWEARKLSCDTYCNQRNSESYYCHSVSRSIEFSKGMTAGMVTTLLFVVFFTVCFKCTRSR